MIHLTTEVGKPGRHELEKRHFPYVHNKPGVQPPVKPTGRVYIPHGYGEQPEWRPHNQMFEPELTERGPDWRSKLRYIPSPDHDTPVGVELWPDNFPSLRYFPGKLNRSTKEYSMYPEGPPYHIGKRCKFNNEHWRSIETQHEITHTTLYGKGRNIKDINQRNSLKAASLGDKPYQAPEYSTDFHKLGSTLPVVNFGGAFQNRPKADTFVPLQPLPAEFRENFDTKERKRRHQDEVNVVKSLEDWRAATPLIQTLPPKDRDDGR